MKELQISAQYMIAHAIAYESIPHVQKLHFELAYISKLNIAHKNMTFLSISAEEDTIFIYFVQL